MPRRVEEGPAINAKDNMGINEMPDCGCIMWPNFRPRNLWEQFYISLSTHLSFCTTVSSEIRDCIFLPRIPGKKFFSTRKECIHLVTTPQ